MNKRILIALNLDETEMTDRVLAAAREIGGSDAQYLCTAVIPPLRGVSLIANYLPKDYDSAVLQEAQTALEKYVEKAFAGSTLPPCKVAHGTPYEEIVRIAEEEDCDCIVVGANKKASKLDGLGPNAARVARNSKKSVMIVR